MKVIDLKKKKEKSEFILNPPNMKPSVHTRNLYLPIKAALAVRKKVAKTVSIFMGGGRFMGRGSAGASCRGMGRGSARAS